MKTVVFDFSTISSLEQFYRQFAHKFRLPSYFSHNLDAIWDLVTAGEIGLPVRIVFKHLPSGTAFLSLIGLFEQAQQEMPTEFSFECRQ